MVLFVRPSIAPGETPTPTPSASADGSTQQRFALDLDIAVPETAATPTRTRFRLFGDAARESPPGQPDGDASPGLTLSRSFDDGERREAFEDFFERLEADRWPDGMGRREERLAGEQMRVMEGGLLGFPGGGALMVRPLEVAHLAKQLWRALSGSPPDPGAVPARLRVVGRGGAAPSVIAVVPMTGRTVGDLEFIGCDGGGGCSLPDSLARPSTLLVVADGAALVRLDGAADDTRIHLREVGVLRLVPPPGDGARSIRITEAESRIPVPVPAWKNRSGGEWVEVGATGLSMQLPAGSYEVELESEEGMTSVVYAGVAAGEITVVSLP